MFSIVKHERLPGPWRLRRRELLRIGGLSLLGLSAIDLERLQSRAAGAADHDSPARRANSCVFLFLFGGPSHIDLWDMKPEAPSEIRGEFKPVATSVPGIHVCEHLPLLARVMAKFCLLRSMTHRMPVHGPACSEMYSGRPYFGPPTTDQAKPEDWPSLASLVTRYGKSQRGLPPSVVTPWYTQFAGQGKRIAGQTGGRMGERYNPFLVQGDPSQADFGMPAVVLPDDVPLDRLFRRGGLLKSIESSVATASPKTQHDVFDQNYRTALEMLGSPATAQMFDLAREPQALRQRYGDHKFAQSLLLARRLVEGGVSLVTVNWDDATRDEIVSPFWDTHNHNFPKLKDQLCPVFDHCFSAFLEDLDSRGLLETTLVVVAGEFGRSPKIGQFVQNAMTEKTGRDHWPHAFTVLLAGGGVRGGQVYGATNSTAGYVVDKPVSPADLAATILLHLGIDPAAHYADVLTGVPHAITTGAPIRDLG